MGAFYAFWNCTTGTKSRKSSYISFNTLNESYNYLSIVLRKLFSIFLFSQTDFLFWDCYFPFFFFFEFVSLFLFVKGAAEAQKGHT